ncbi:hypothetical protein [Sulfitobacter dubius]|uniref:hypothetical protein n=1 Tax=Sulfitobacter dubius TaxID=218673 RepID=UPI0030D9B6D0
MHHVSGDLHRCPRCGVEEERTSQREMVRRFLQSEALYFVALGGNRSSKSWSGSVCGVMTAMGAAHPDVVELLRRNGLKPGRLPQAPSLVLAGSITNDDSRDYLRPIYDSLLPDAWEWSARFAAQTASTWQPGSGAGLPGSVLFKTTSGADASKRWQGTSTPLVHNDEDHGDVEVLREQLRAVADQGGRWLGTFTPTRGKSRLVVDVLFRDPPRASGEVEVYRLDPVDNPMIDGDAMGRWLASMTAKERDVRRYARFVQLDGLVHPTWDESVHVVPAIDPAEMADWPRVDGLDFGFRAPFAYLWGAVDPRGVLHIIRARYVPQVNTDAHIYEVHRAEACPACWPGPDDWPADRWWDRRFRAAESCAVCNGSGRAVPEPYARAADPADADARDRWAAMGLPTTAAIKARREGYGAIDQLLEVRNGSPGLVVHDHPSTAPLRKEISELAWKDHEAGKRSQLTVHRETEVVGADHAWDALRYLVMEARRLRLVDYFHESRK